MDNEHKRTLGIYMNRDPGRFDRVRKTSGLWDQLDTWLMKKAFHSASLVRGNYVAMDSLVEALARDGSMDRYEIFTSAASANSLKQRIRSHWKVREDRVGINPMGALLEGLDKLSLTALLTPSLVSGEPFRIRGCIASNCFPIVVLSHGFSEPTMLYDTFFRILLGNTYPCDSIICSSHASKTAMSRIFEHISENFNRDFGANVKFSGRIDQIPLCVDTETLKPLDKAESRRQFKLPKDALILLFLGRISPLKADLFPLLSVFRMLVNSNVDRKLVLIIAGTAEEPYTVALTTFIKAYSLEKNVRILSDIPDHAKAALLSSADIFVAPADSIQESFGLSPVEAMACGIPQVVADWNGYRDTVVHGETGFLVPTYWTECDRDLNVTDLLFGWEFDHLSVGQSIAMDCGSLLSSLQTMIDNDGLRHEVSKLSRQRAVEMYSYRAVAGQYEGLCLELSQIAHGLAACPSSSSFAMPHYFKFFRSHASQLIDDDCPLVLALLGGETHLRWLLSTLTTPFAGPELINADLITFAIDGLRRNASMLADGAGACTTAVTFGQLVESLAGTGAYHRDFIRRNVMWMIKQGIVTASVCQGTKSSM